jgi:hypothetical protein
MTNRREPPVQDDRDIDRRHVIQFLAKFGAIALGSAVTARTAFAQSQPKQHSGTVGSRPTPFSADELVNSGHRFFGNVSRGLASAIESAGQKWGQPNGYILGQEGGAAFVGGLRYGEGVLYTRNAGDRRVFWQGPSFGFDFGGDGSRTMMLVYNLPATDGIFKRFGGVDGSAYVVGGFSMTALIADEMVVVPISSGVGARLGVNLGYLKFTPEATWNPF